MVSKELVFTYVNLSMKHKMTRPIYYKKIHPKIAFSRLDGGIHIVETESL